jgi:hypothetical protein
MVTQWLLVGLCVALYIALYLVLWSVKGRDQPLNKARTSIVHELPQDHSVTFVGEPIDWTAEHREDAEVVDWSEKGWA